METCVFCNSADNLNTGLDITIEDGSKVHVKICDTHSEDATVKSARIAYVSRQTEIQKVLAQAKALGLSLSVTPSGLSVAQSPVQPTQPRIIQRVAKVVDSDVNSLDENDPDVVSTESLTGRGMRSVGGQTSFGSVESHQSIDTSGLKDKLDPALLKGKAKMEIVEGRDGQPLMLPRKRVDKTGTTMLNITKIEDDGKLQKRFKSMAKESMKQGGEPDFARSGYQNSTRDCPICRGDCIVNGQDCPKCHGSGIISVY